MGSIRPRPVSLAPPPPDAGQLIAGKYRIERLIGQGGMGTVLAARHELLDVPVAVKVLSSEFVHQPSVLTRFLREARAVAHLKSEHVARVMDVGTIGDGQPYIVMELLEGEDLEHRLEHGPMEIAQAADCLLQALEAMAHAHAAGIVHRDLKPANLFLSATPDGREVVKVLDFGIAKLTGATSRMDGSRVGELTGEHSTLGSPSYMAPEQVRGSQHVDRRADIWALGTILYELVAGKVAFGGQSVGEIFGAVLHSTPTPLRTLRPDAPEELDRVVSRCLKQAPEDRFADVAELARAVAPFGSGAWQGHVTRIERTLERAGKSSDPESHAPRGFTSTVGGARDTTEPASGPASHLRPRIAPALSGSEPVTAAAETLAPPEPASLPGLKRKRWGHLWPLVSAGAALAVVLAVAARVRAPNAIRPDLRSSAGTAEAPSAVAPPTTTATLPIAAPPSAVVPSVLSPDSSASAAGAKPSVPSRPAPAAVPRPRPAKSGYPGVLSSPD